jgi:hypothetical protein
MQNHPSYQKLERAALDGNYTVEQVRALSFTQATTLLGERPASFTFLENIKGGIIRALQDREDEVNLQQIKLRITSWLDINFPDWKAEHGREGSKPFVTIWMEGKP